MCRSGKYVGNRCGEGWSGRRGFMECGDGLEEFVKIIIDLYIMVRHGHIVR
jgi:hypothetical protein